MATTPNIGFELPTVGGDNNTWGNDLNSNWTLADTEIQALLDAVSSLSDDLAALEAKTLIPVGGLHLSTTATNPATSLGYGTWEAYAAGRALVGVGDNGTTTWAGGDEDGDDTITLNEFELPTHNHTIPVGTKILTGADEPDVTLGANGDIYLQTSGDTVDGPNTTETSLGRLVGGSAEQASFSTGGGSAHSNVQPSIAVYVWRRTA